MEFIYLDGVIETHKEVCRLSWDFLDALRYPNSNTRITILEKIENRLDWSVEIYLSFFLFFLHFFIDYFFARPFARKCLGELATAKHIKKFAQSTMEIIQYGSFFWFGCYIVGFQPWSWPSILWWKGWKNGEHFAMSPEFKFFYLLYGARYISNTASVLLAHKQKDFNVLFIHHLVTVILVNISYSFGFVRVGTIVMVLFDPVDLPLHIAKLLKYCADQHGLNAKIFQKGADFVFVIFVLTFISTRNIIYPYIVWSGIIESSGLIPDDLGTNICRLLLVVLLVIQFIWLSLIFKAINKIIIKGSVEDVRSDEEDEEEEKKDK